MLHIYLREREQSYKVDSYVVSCAALISVPCIQPTLSVEVASLVQMRNAISKRASLNEKKKGLM